MPSFFIPARNSRHRIACFALYKALLQQASRIPLPDDLATAWGPVNPIKSLTRRAFRRNRNDTSPRLVYPALKAGYQILALLRSAAAAATPPSSPSANPSDDYNSIITFLRARLAERSRTLAAKEEHPPNSRTPRKPSTAPRPDAVPLLVNVTPAPTPANPNPKPVYATPSRPRPAAELGGSGRRKIPKLDMASDFPLLRLSKPQPGLLSRVLTQKIRRRVARAGSIHSFHEERLPNAELEDAWERSVRALLLEEKNAGTRDEAGRIRDEHRDGNTFRQTVWVHGVVHTGKVLTEERAHQVARADAMRNLIAEETRLAEEEKAQRAVERRVRWEERMLEEHGAEWRELFPNLKESESDVSS
ncbi:hypothetical protein M426DRAFT_18002 [Hypoxylon sp. CI-4A]|nr:hypothetical protein M426DRAFT_18002 [Hypoxylon sp. CI-4A]